jgi:protein ImuB
MGLGGAALQRCDKNFPFQQRLQPLRSKIGSSMFACIHIPDFPVQASLLPEPPEIRATLTNSPVAILDGPATLPRVFATSSTARRAGIQTGMTKLQAEICAGIVLRKRSLTEEESAQAALLDCAGKFSPRVESTAPGDVILDLAGTEKLFGKNVARQAPWPHAARAITAQAAAAGFHARIAIAANPDTTFLAARGFHENKIIPVGEEARHLAPLPIEALPISPEMRETLDSWGIRTFQSLAVLPVVAIVERLGQEGLYIQKLARGAITRPLLTFEPNAEFVASYEFDDPVETLESIFFILNRLLQELCTRLLNTAQAASELRLTVGLNVRQLQSGKNKINCEKKTENAKQVAAGEQSEHIWKLPVPTQDKNLLFSLLRLHLEKTTFSAPIRQLRLEVIPVKPRLAQGNLFAPPSPESEKLELTLERIRGVVGAADAEGTNCVGSPHLLDTHKPGSFTLHHFSSPEDTNALTTQNLSSNPKQENCHPERSRSRREADRSAESKDLYSSRNLKVSEFSAPVIALRIFRPALETTVELDGKKPHFVHLWSRHRRVLGASGPWCSSGNWWNASAWTREEWDIAIQTPAGLGFYRIYRDRLRRQWFVEGVFD